MPPRPCRGSQQSANSLVEEERFMTHRAVRSLNKSYAIGRIRVVSWQLRCQQCPQFCRDEFSLRQHSPLPMFFGHICTSDQKTCALRQPVSIRFAIR